MLEMHLPSGGAVMAGSAVGVRECSSLSDLSRYFHINKAHAAMLSQQVIGKMPSV